METKESRRPAQQRPPTQKPPAKRPPAQKGTAQRQPVKKKVSSKPAPQGRSRTGTQSRRDTAGRTLQKKVAARRRTVPKKPAPDVVYVQPTPFNTTRFVLCILIVLAIVLAVIFGMSIFFKVDADKITVSGTSKYTAWQIREASGIKDGENLLSISEPRISSNITEELPYVNKVRVGIKLPDTVKIEIEELDVVYSVEASDSSWWLVRSDGFLVEKTNSADAELHTKLLGVRLADPVQGQQANAYEPSQESEDGTTPVTAPVTVYASEQLEIALSITQYLEDCGMIGQVSSIDVSNLGDLQLWYEDQYQVMLGDGLELARKIKSMKAAIDQMGDYQSGVLDVSFTTWPNEVGYTPFS